MSDIYINDRMAINRWAYLSAYAIAVKHGFVGTEIEWLASLKGDQGDQGDPGVSLSYQGAYAAETTYAYNDAVTYNGSIYLHVGEDSTTGTAPTDTDVWAKIFDASAASEDIASHVADAAAASQAAAAAQTAAEAAETGAEDAKLAAQTAQAAAEEAQGRVEDAVTDAEAAQDGAEAAQAAAESAKTAADASATAASIAEENARTHAYNAQVAAGTAAGYASGAQTAQTAAEAAQAAAEQAERDASDSVGAAAGYAEDSQAWATGYRGNTPVSSGDQYHNNSKYWADEAAQSATDAGTAKTAAETAQTATEAAQAAAEAAAASIEQSAAQISANTSRIDYVALREEEDRQMLLGSVAEVVEDTYDELRSAPIHNAITIGSSVYPRMDRTRMAIDRILGRTVAWNQLVSVTSPADLSSPVKGIDVAWTDGKYTLAGTATDSGGRTSRQAKLIALEKDHVYFASFSSAHTFDWYLSSDTSGSVLAILHNQHTIFKITASDKAKLGFNAVNGTTVNESYYIFITDLTAMYGTTLADSIYAMEQATAGAGVAYVRARLPLDYYAYNAGELKAPVVGGVDVVGFNLWDEVWDVGRIGASTGQNADTGTDIRSKNYIPVFPNTLYCIANSNTVTVYFYDADKAYIGNTNPLNSGAPTFTTPSNCHFMRFCTLTNQNIGYNPSVNPICINLSKTTGTPKNGDYLPYLSTSLPLPSTRLDGVGDAQDYIEVVEDGENDYSLIKTAKMELIDMGTIDYSITNSHCFYASTAMPRIKLQTSASAIPNIICTKYITGSASQAYNGSAGNVVSIGIAGLLGEGRIAVYDENYSDAAAFKTAMNGVMLAVELATPTETVLAEHLTLAEVSAIAENGGIIGAVNANGDIVQPDLTVDAVVSKSAS